MKSQFKTLLKVVSIPLATILLGFIGLICLDEYNDRTRESKHQSQAEFIGGQGQLKVAYLVFVMVMLTTWRKMILLILS